MSIITEPAHLSREHFVTFPDTLRAALLLSFTGICSAAQLLSYPYGI